MEVRVTHRFLLGIGLIIATMPGSAWGAPKDGTARGLDVFIQAPTEIPAGTSLPVQVRVFGFPTIGTLRPLAGATVEATWDPESLGRSVAKLPTPVTITCDQEGRGHLDIEVPQCQGSPVLLVAARLAGHERIRSVMVKLTPRYELDLRTSDTAVVPGGAISAWVMMRDRTTGGPAAGKAVDVVLKEGGLVRSSRRLTTDRAGAASVELKIPWVDDPEARWVLWARTALGHGDEVETQATLFVREETPQIPTLKVHWTTRKASPGARASYAIQVRDGAGHGLAGLGVRVWVGPKGTDAPTDDKAWNQASTEVRSDADGNALLTVETPRTVSPRGSSLTVVGKATVEGHSLVDRDTMDLVTPAPELELRPELGVLLPGQRQRLFLHTTFDGKPIATEVGLDGHDLHARVRTNRRGWGEAFWQVPVDLGAKVPDEAAAGCAGQVAATVRVRWLEGMGKPFNRCVGVDRDAVAVVRPDRPMVEAGANLGVRILGAKGSASLAMQGAGHGAGHSAWLAESSQGATITLPASARGPWTITATGLSLPEDRHVLGARVLVLPKPMPRLVARRGPEHARPGGMISVQAVLDDGQGRPLAGSVGAVVFDKMGGTHPERLLALDTRRTLAAEADIEESDIDGFLGGDPAFDSERWAALAGDVPNPPKPAFDPQATIEQTVKEEFRRIVQSLEGAIFESSSDPERLRDVRVRTATGYALNPEMLTLVTEAMGEAPVTPGGEPWLLADLMSIDRQVNFDTVARRVARLKLFNLLSSVRSYLFDRKIDRDEPALRDGNALLRRMVRDETLSSGDLLDPWGHGMQFVRSHEARIPFLSTVPGFRLVSAGPDGRFGSPDDVRDPFQRVLASKTPYASAVDEDRLVDAKWDMQVGEETIESWKALLEELTGQALGGEATGVGGLGLVGTGAGGGGYGQDAAGQVRRRERSIDPGSAHWLPPMRTDEQGRVSLRVPLGDAETTWQIVLVAIPDGGLPATASVEAETALPLSVRADAGATWTAGDEVDVALRVRNRTDKSLSVALRISASGSVLLVDGKAAKQTLSVAARSATTTTVRVRALGAGTGVLDASVEAAGHSDRIRHEWPTKAAGEVFTAENVAWVETSATVAVPAGTQANPAQGPARLVLEKGIEPALASALDALTPDSLSGLRALADALEVTARIAAWALVRGGETHPLAVRARHIAGQLKARPELEASPKPKRKGQDSWEQPLLARARIWAAIANPDKVSKANQPECPSAKALSLSTALDWLALARHAERSDEDACWAGLRASVLNQLGSENHPLALAKAVLAFIETPSQVPVVMALARRLLASASVRADGALVLPEPLVRDRAARSIIMAALLRSSRTWAADRTALPSRLVARLYLERDVTGGYGSAEATRHAVLSLLETENPASAATEIRYAELSPKGKVLRQGVLQLRDDRTATLALLPETESVRIQSSAPGLLARSQRPLFRSFFRPVDPSASPLHLDLLMPQAPVRGTVASLQVTVRHELGRSVPITVRIPLPPGVALAERIEKIAQIQGAIYLRTELDGDALPRVMTVPLRFGLAGKLTMPEATARITNDQVAPARSPARPLLVMPGPPA
jgi:hypothetical protein